MKIHSFVPEIFIFCIISYFFVIPPLFVTTQMVQSLDFSIFSFQNLIHFILSIFLILFYKNKSNTVYANLTNKRNFFNGILFFVCFCLICLNSLLFNFISETFTNSNQNNLIIVSKPTSLVEYVICICNLFFAAFFEETIYRFYLPSFMLALCFKLIKKENDDKNYTLLKILIESFVMLIFALSHRYLGIFSVLNAIIAHIILRLTFIFSKNIFCSTLAHFLYNFLSLIMY